MAALQSPTQRFLRDLGRREEVAAGFLPQMLASLQQIYRNEVTANFVPLEAQAFLDHELAYTTQSHWLDLLKTYLNLPQLYGTVMLKNGNELISQFGIRLTGDQLITSNEFNSHVKPLLLLVRDDLRDNLRKIGQLKQQWDVVRDDILRIRSWLLADSTGKLKLRVSPDIVRAEMARVGAELLRMASTGNQLRDILQQGIRHVLGQIRDLRAQLLATDLLRYLSARFGFKTAHDSPALIKMRNFYELVLRRLDAERPVLSERIVFAPNVAALQSMQGRRAFSQPLSASSVQPQSGENERRASSAQARLQVERVRSMVSADAGRRHSLPYSRTRRATGTTKQDRRRASSAPGRGL
jgi:hypothetical protein